MKPFYSIQYLRAFAALSVVAFHTNFAGTVGQAGVDIFFVISGFIMWITTERERTPGWFLLKRFIRIWPLYVIATLAMAVHNRPPLIYLLESLVFIPYRDMSGHIWPVLVQGWTLNYEMLFYCIIASSLLLKRRHMIIAISTAIIALVVIGIVMRSSNAIVQTFTSPLLLEFLAGIWIWTLMTLGRKLGLMTGVGLMVLSLVLFGLSQLDGAAERDRFIVWGVPSAMLVGGALLIEDAAPLSNWAILKTLGDASYSIYLFHPFVMKTTLRVFNRFPKIGAVAGVIIVAAGVGTGVYFLIERRLTKMLGRIVSSRRKIEKVSPVT